MWTLFTWMAGFAVFMMFAAVTVVVTACISIAGASVFLLASLNMVKDKLIDFKGKKLIIIDETTRSVEER